METFPELQQKFLKNKEKWKIMLHEKTLNFQTNLTCSYIFTIIKVGPHHWNINRFNMVLACNGEFNSYFKKRWRHTPSWKLGWVWTVSTSCLQEGGDEWSSCAKCLRFCHIWNNIGIKIIIIHCILARTSSQKTPKKS